MPVTAGKQFTSERDIGPLDATERERLRYAVAAVVAEHGYERATVTRVAERAGLPPAALDALSADMAGCLLAAYDDAVDHILSLIAGASSAGGTPQERFRLGLGAFLRFCVYEPELAHMCLVDVNAAGSPSLARRSDAIKRIARLIESEAPARGPRPAEPDEAAPADMPERQPTLVALMLVGAVHHLAGTRVAAGQAGQLTQLAPEIERALAPLVETIAAPSSGGR
jgi:AcrR family transcriptional regulator